MKMRDIIKWLPVGKMTRRYIKRAHHLAAENTRLRAALESQERLFSKIPTDDFTRGRKFELMALRHLMETKATSTTSVPDATGTP